MSFRSLAQRSFVKLRDPEANPVTSDVVLSFRTDQACSPYTITNVT